MALRLPAPPLPPPATKAAVLDPDHFGKVLAGLHAGGRYYDVLAEAMRADGYPTASVFNWRTPFLWTAIAPIPSSVRRVLLTSLGAAVALIAIWTASRRSGSAAVVTSLAAFGVAILTSAPGAVGMGEAWAGLLVGLSVCAYASERPGTGAVCGLMALFIRELVAPYALLCAVVAGLCQRWREFALWSVGGVAYGLYFTAHVVGVWSHQLPGDVSQGDWVALGGVPFLLSTVKWNGVLLLAPQVYTALAFALIAVACVLPCVPLHLRLATSVYALSFLIVGQSHNRYWGYLTWPTWMLACGYGADGLRRAWVDLTTRAAAAARSRRPTGGP